MSTIAHAFTSTNDALEFEALCAGLNMAAGYTLFIVRATQDALREEFLAAVSSRHPAWRLLRCHLQADSKASLVTQMEQAAEGPMPHTMFVVGLDAAIDLRQTHSDIHAFLNSNRGYLRERFPFPLVFFVANYGLRELPSRMPDLWSWRYGVFLFNGHASQSAGHLERFAGQNPWEIPPEERLRRREVLQELVHNGNLESSVLASAWATLGDLELTRDVGTARACFEQALSLCREIGDRPGEADALQSLGELAIQQDRHADAEQLYHQALSLYRQIGHRLGEANALHGMGLLARARGEVAIAGSLLEDAQLIYSAIGMQIDGNTVAETIASPPGS
ncbi:MAG: tetratricopeptide repeat protein [Bryobacterales bacterium]|nr:tetratricopeptide repeat protein [Bryobacterales bacterium]